MTGNQHSHTAAHEATQDIRHEEHRHRYGRLQESLRRDELEALLCFSPENIYYLTGFETIGHYFLQCLVVFADEDPILIVRSFEEANVAALTWLSSSRGYRDYEDISESIAEVTRKTRGRVGFESEAWFLSASKVVKLNELFGPRLIPTCGLVEELRMVKSSAEIELIRAAARYTEAGMEAAFDASGPGAIEDEIAGAVYQAMISSGSSYPSLPPFITTGPRSALPHATWSGRRLEQGDVLFYEVGGSAGRYGAALIRTGCVGEPSAAVRQTVMNASAVILDALDALIAAIKPGVTGEDVHRASRDVIEQSGWGDLNRNRSGYSIGISFPPDWGEGQIYSLRELERRPLQPGMVFHLVPNVLLPNVAAIGFSETVLVTEAGCECLTDYRREFMTV
jgi:Xaa-Pro dipeptidase